MYTMFVVVVVAFNNNKCILFFFIFIFKVFFPATFVLFFNFFYGGKNYLSPLFILVYNKKIYFFCILVSLITNRR
jgi:hypothetical protein